MRMFVMIDAKTLLQLSGADLTQLEFVRRALS